ncbi:MAG: HD-GYP domain-containing protein, partial [Candidatus Eiseniibacteriota bacterium]
WLGAEPEAPERSRPERRRASVGPVSGEALLARVEEALLERREPAAGGDESWACLDLARRLANALGGARTPQDRVDLIVEGFDTFFGVRGSLVIRRGPQQEWIEAGQGLEDAAVQCIADEIARRSSHERDIRPFLAQLDVDGSPRDVACLAVHRTDFEIDLALDLVRAPQAPGLREALMNLIGAALRAAAAAERLARLEEARSSRMPTLEETLALTRELTGVTNRAALCERILAAVRRELGAARSALFLTREGGEGLLALQSVSGFSGVVLDRLGLSGTHGIGREVFADGDVCRLAAISPGGGADREIRRLADAGLVWGAPLELAERRLGLLTFGARDGDPVLTDADRSRLRMVRGAASIALSNVERMEELRNLSLGSLRSLAGAAELRRPHDRGHGERVACIAVDLGRAAGLSPEDLRDLSHCALLHDAGKGALSASEQDDGSALRMHPVLATRILAPARPPSRVVQGIEQHHERWDGHGYPYGLEGPAIHLFARIVAIANEWDRLTAGEAPLAREEALRRLELGAGIRFDPGLVSLFAGETGGSRHRTPSREISIEEIVGT